MQYLNLSNWERKKGKESKHKWSDIDSSPQALSEIVA